jgi:hypothetical protein
MTTNLAATVAAAQRIINRTMLPDSCAIQSLTGETSDGAGGTTGGAWTTTATVDCQVTTATSGGPNGQETVVADGVAEVVDASIALPAGTAVTAKQRIVHTDSRTAAVTTYAVLAVSKPTGFELNRTVKGKVTT